MVKALPEVRVCPASFPTIGANSPPGGDQLTAPPLSSPDTELGSNQNRHPCPSPLTIVNSRVVESPTPLEKTGCRALAVSREAGYAAGGQTAKVPAFGRYPTQNAPNPLGPSCRKGVPCCLFGPCPARLLGQRSGHQALTNVSHSQAWFQEGAPVTRIQARET
ncbi:hypothetical protein D4764_19G0000050 [Takifugu flavidus]|uniref:Uncharacterized protein n=1 Tax=Takifugu flavidus TaxID=433684 RepID=A0A5C6NRB0_9TELE|nr:hypothetical protein D4764_19G0000050 [Takifugu flavidus]